MNPSNPGTAGTGGGGTAGIGGTTGIGGAGWPAGVGGSLGDAGGPGSECGASTGAGNCITTGGTAGGGTAGIGGTSGGGATGGTGGSAPLPACTANALTFGVCIANDAEGTSPTSLDTHTSGAATIEAVGSVAAPGSCRRAIGRGGPSDWWFQARAADDRLWTIGVQGLGGSTPLVSKGDVVTLDADWKTTCAGPANCFSDARLQLSDAAGTPLLWAGRRSIVGSFPDDQTWISFKGGDYACGSVDMYCDRRERNVIATVNGSSMTLPPYGAASIGGYFVEVTSIPAGLCGDSGPPFHAAAAKVSPSTDP